MTSIALPAADFRRADVAPTTRLRLTVRGRRVLVAVAAAPAIAVLAWAALSGGAALASSSAGAPAGSFETVVVQPGDSLWSIAEQVAPQADPRDVVDAIARLNALDGGALSTGESLSIPQEYAGH